jgi:hypothetical protein
MVCESFVAALLRDGQRTGLVDLEEPLPNFRSCHSRNLILQSSKCEHVSFGNRSKDFVNSENFIINELHISVLRETQARTINSSTMRKIDLRKPRGLT